jgi:hypothetical protein
VRTQQGYWDRNQIAVSAWRFTQRASNALVAVQQLHSPKQIIERETIDCPKVVYVLNSDAR